MAKAKDEAKIKFTAETGEFNNAIKKSGQELTELRAEFKLNETQMQATGKTVEGLQTAHKNLEAQLESAQRKTEALSQKVQKAIEIYGENSEEVSKLRTQLVNAQIAEEKIKQQINNTNAEIEKQVSSLENQKRASAESETATGKLTSTIKNQQTELTRLKDDYVEAVLQYGKTSDEALELERKIGNLSDELQNNQDKLAGASYKAKDLDQSLDNVGDSADSAGDGFTVLKGVVADLASNAIQGAIGKVSEFIGYLGELPAATMELRQDMATLTTSFDEAGHSTEVATDTWKELYKVFGEDDRAVEAANNISKMAKNQEDLNDWVTITTGVFGTYQDSLPVEALAESSNETAKTGKVTGNLADALNWSSEAATMFAKYMSEDVTTAEDAFNVALSECTTEQERQALITDTLTALYGGAAETYRETAGAQMEAKEATAEQILAEANLADAIEPVTTAFTVLKTELLNYFAPAIEKVSGLMVGALDWAREHPTAMKAIGAALVVITAAFTALTGVIAVYTIAQWAMNSAVLASPVTWIIVGIVAAIALLVAGFTVLWNECEGFRNFFINAWASIKNVWSEVQPFFEILWVGVQEAFSVVKENLIASFKIAWETIKLIWSVASSYFQMVWNNIKQIFSVVKTFFVGAFQTAWAGIKLVWSAVTGYFRNIWNTIKGIFSVVKSVLSGDFRSAWESIKGIVSGWTSYFKNIWSGIKNVFSSVKSWFSSTFQSAYSAVKNIWSNISGFFSGLVSKIQTSVSKVADILTKPFNTAKEAIVKVVDKIKEVFGGMKLEFPNIKMPHFSISPKGWKIGDLLDGSIPKLGIEFYKDGAIFTRPTIFGMNGNNAMVGGEAGPEAMLPIDKLEGYVANAVEKTMNVVNLESLAHSIEDLASRPIELYVGDRQVALATASANDTVNGQRTTFKSRGLILE